MQNKTGSDKNSEQYKLDYDKTFEQYKLLADIRFKLLAFVPTLTSIGVALLNVSNIEAEAAFALGLVGFFATWGIILYELRNSTLYDVAIGRAARLEASLGFKRFYHTGVLTDEDQKYGGVLTERVKIDLNTKSGDPKNNKDNVRKGNTQIPSDEIGRKLKQRFLGMDTIHDKGLSLVYGSALGAWMYVIVSSLLISLLMPFLKSQLWLKPSIMIVSLIFAALMLWYTFRQFQLNDDRRRDWQKSNRVGSEVEKTV